MRDSPVKLKELPAEFSQTEHNLCPLKICDHSNAPKILGSRCPDCGGICVQWEDDKHKNMV
jgi:hypothetical protein